MRIVLAPWEWHTDQHGESYWRKPGGDYAGGCLDLRSRTEAGTPGVASGLGLFAYKTLPAGIKVAAELGDDPLAAMTTTQRRGLATALGLDARQIGGTTLAEVLAEFVLGTLADPSGQARVKPLRMNRRGARLHLKGFGQLYHTRLDKAHPAYTQTLAVRKIDYERHSQRGRLSLEALQRWTGWDMRELGASEDELLPTAFRADGSRTPSTTLTESWPTDSTTLSSGQDNPWTEESGDLQVAGGELRAVGNFGVGNISCDTALSSDDHQHTADCRQPGSGAPGSPVILLARYDAAVTGSLPSNAYLVRKNYAGGQYNSTLSKYVNGTITDLDTDTTAVSDTEECRVKCDGSEISGYVGAVTLGPVTDTDISGNLQCGVRLVGAVSDATNAADNHTMEDLGGAAAAYGPALALLGVGW